jgi:methanogenic corrinoid protein MtbC1
VIFDVEPRGIILYFWAVTSEIQPYKSLLMNAILEKLKEAVENGKIDMKSPFPPNMRGQEGASELTLKALEAGVSPQQILDMSLVSAMEKVGKNFTEKKIFVPQMLMAARAMGASMTQLKPFFASGEIKTKGTFIIGTVKGDLHDIGKNLVSMMVEGSGWTVVDLGVDVAAEKIIDALAQHKDAVVGLSALLTTTMVNMKDIVSIIKGKLPDTKVIIGGAPVNTEYCIKIGADFYAPDPNGAVEFLNKLVA